MGERERRSHHAQSAQDLETGALGAERCAGMISIMPHTGDGADWPRDAAVGVAFRAVKREIMNISGKKLALGRSELGGNQGLS